MRLSLLAILALAVACGDLVSTSTTGLPSDHEGDESCDPWDTWCEPDPPCDGTSLCEPPEDDEEEDEDHGCGSFICIDEGPANCDPGAQDCRRGQKCTGYVSTPGYCCVDDDKCVPIIGDKKYGDACTRGVDNDDCATGLFCMTRTSGDTGDGVCMAFCDINLPNPNDSCDTRGAIDGQCVPFCDGTLPLCYVPCDPLAQDCIGPQGCYGGGQSFVCTFSGHAEDEGNDNDDCYTVQSCKPGLMCAAGHGQEGCESDACCTPFCECDPDQPEGIDSPECPTEGEQCVCYFTEDAPPDYAHVGLCYLPDA
jgi:hypothetical protein